MATPSEGKQHRKTSRPGQSADDIIRLALCVCECVCLTLVPFLLQGGTRQVSSHAYPSHSLLPTRTSHQMVSEFFFLPPGGAPDELLSSSSIFDHVDRLSRGSSDGTRRPANKVQLIAMQPRPSPAHPSPAHQSHSQPSPTLSERVNTEVGGIQRFKRSYWSHVTLLCSDTLVRQSATWLCNAKAFL